MYKIDFQLNFDTTSRWLSVEIMNGQLLPSITITGGPKSKSVGDAP
jgi:hypothetical protein